MSVEINYRKLRKELGLTQTQVAVRVGVSLMTYQLWERGAMSPKPENYEKLLEALEVVPFSGE